MAKVRGEYEESISKNESDMISLKKRQNDATSELVDQVENLSRVKTKVEKERSQAQMELLDVTSQLDEISKIKIRAEASVRALEEQVRDLRSKDDENTRIIEEMTIVKNKLQSGSDERMNLLEETENKVCAFCAADISTSTAEGLNNLLNLKEKVCLKHNLVLRCYNISKTL